MTIMTTEVVNGGLALGRAVRHKLWHDASKNEIVTRIKRKKLNSAVGALLFHAEQEASASAVVHWFTKNLPAHLTVKDNPFLVAVQSGEMTKEQAFWVMQVAVCAGDNAADELIDEAGGQESVAGSEAARARQSWEFGTPQAKLASWFNLQSFINPFDAIYSPEAHKAAVVALGDTIRVQVDRRLRERNAVWIGIRIDRNNFGVPEILNGPWGDCNFALGGPGIADSYPVHGLEELAHCLHLSESDARQVVIRHEADCSAKYLVGEVLGMIG